MYKIVGNDGKTYGPVSADTIREWIVQGRVEGRTPVLPEGAGEWTFVGLLPKFARESGGTPPVMSPPKISAPPPRGTNGFATAGFVFGLVSWLFCCCCGGAPFNILGLIFSIVALVQIGGQTQKQEGRGLALAGLICSATSLLFGFGLGLMQLALEPARFNFHCGSI
jgi:hypothetical protein